MKPVFKKGAGRLGQPRQGRETK